jgi:2-hydroxychromene-2-carboxylate isomerase
LPPGAWFYFDLSSPEAYLAAERILHLLPAPAEWMPVLASELPGGGASQTEPHDTSEALELLRGDIARRARELGLQPLRWPSPFPFDSALAMRAATYAKSIGRTVPFAQAAFRQAFAGGHSLQEVDHVLIAAAACEMHPAAVLAGTELRSVERQLSRSTGHAAQAGILDVPAVLVGAEPSAGRILSGARAVEEAAAYMTSLLSSAPSGPPAAAGSR